MQCADQTQLTEMALRSRSWTLLRDVVRTAKELPVDERIQSMKRIREVFDETKHVKDEAECVKEQAPAAVRLLGKARTRTRPFVWHLVHGRIEVQFREAKDSLRLLRMRLPRYRRPTIRTELDDGQSGGVFVVRKGEVVSGKANSVENAPYKNWDGSNLDPDALARHERSIRRFQFRDRPGGPPTGPTFDTPIPIEY